MKKPLTRWAAPAAIAFLLVLAAVFAVMTVRQSGHFDRAFDEMVNGLRVTVLDLNGNVVSDTLPGVAGDHSKREEFREALATGAGTAVRRSATTGADTIYSARQIGPHVLRLAIPFTELNRLRAVDRRGDTVAALAVLFVMVFAVALAFRMRRRMAAIASERDAERRRVEEAERMARFRRDFVADFSHELRTPLTGIMGAAELLGGEGAARLSATSRHRLAETLRSQSRRLEELSAEVLELAELDAVSPGAVAQGSVDLAAAVENAVGLCRSEAEASGSVIVLGAMDSVVAAIPCLYAERIAGNLVINAVRHASARTVTVSVKAEGAYAALTVADDGVGIEEEHLKRIFERFYRVDKARSRERGGTGLGLAIVKHTAEVFGGTAQVSSSPGEGTVFTVRIPAFRGDADHKADNALL